MTNEELANMSEEERAELRLKMISNVIPVICKSLCKVKGLPEEKWSDFIPHAFPIIQEHSRIENGVALPN